MLDDDLFFCKNARPTITPGASVVPYVLPNGLVSNAWMDLKTAIDMGRGQSIYAHFRVATTFTGAAANWLRPFIVVDDVINFINVATNAGLIIARGPEIVTAGLLKDIDAEIALPPLNDLAIPSTENGKRYIGLGVEALVPVSDFTAGGIDAWLSPYPRGVRPSAHPSGY